MLRQAIHSRHSCARSSPDSAMDLSEIEKFRDPIWRVSNLYSIRERGGKVIPFRPRPQQSQVLDMIFRRGLKRIVILKARQIGFSTLLGVICADQLCWNTGKQVSVVDKTQEDARQKSHDLWPDWAISDSRATYSVRASAVR